MKLPNGCMRIKNAPVPQPVIFNDAECLYLAIRIGNNVYGVIGIPVKKDSLDSFEHSILLSVINECALAMENSQNAIEKEKNAILAKNEQLRADLLRAISHDLRTPLCSIYGNADMLLNMIPASIRQLNIRFTRISMTILNG